MSTQTLWTERNRGQTPAVTISELYQRITHFLKDLKSQPAVMSELTLQSDLLLEALPRLITSLSQKPGLMQAQNLTLEAMGLGMVLGACDGVLLFQEHTLPAPAQFDIDGKELKRLTQVLAKNLSEITLVAQTNWKRAHPDDLHLLSGYGKDQNLRSLEEGGQLASDPKTKLLDFQKFLLASVKGGYAMGMAEAAVMWVAEA